MLHAAFQPLRVDEEALAYSAHQEVGQGGHFLGAAHTLERFRECFYRPLVSSTENYERWNRNGANDTAARASEIWKKTLSEYEKPPIDADLPTFRHAYRRWRCIAEAAPSSIAPSKSSRGSRGFG